MDNTNKNLKTNSAELQDEQLDQVQGGAFFSNTQNTKVSPLDATVSPLDATVNPLDATVSPLDATVSPLDATVNPFSNPKII